LDNGPQEAELLYILIFQGQTGDATCKLVVKTTLEQACSAIMYETLNGYSTVFTAAILSANLENIRDETYALRAVHDFKTLRTVDNNAESRIVGFWC
jgi:hypothetical protein